MSAGHDSTEGGPVGFLTLQVHNWIVLVQCKANGRVYSPTQKRTNNATIARSEIPITRDPGVAVRCRHSITAIGKIAGA